MAERIFGQKIRYFSTEKKNATVKCFQGHLTEKVGTLNLWSKHMSNDHTREHDFSVTGSWYVGYQNKPKSDLRRLYGEWLLSGTAHKHKMQS